MQMRVARCDDATGFVETKRIGDLEIAQDLQFERRSWRAERIAWVVASLVLISALLGLLGPGPLGKAVAASTDKSLSVEYYRMERYESPVKLRISAHGHLATGGEFRLWFDRRFIEAIEIKSIEPEPERQEISSDRFVYVFKTGDAPSTIKVFFHLEPNTFGKTPAQLGVVGGPELRFSQFFLP